MIIHYPFLNSALTVLPQSCRYSLVTGATVKTDKVVDTRMVSYTLSLRLLEQGLGQTHIVVTGLPSRMLMKVKTGIPRTMPPTVLTKFHAASCAKVTIHIS